MKRSGKLAIAVRLYESVDDARVTIAGSYINTFRNTSSLISALVARGSRVSVSCLL